MGIRFLALFLFFTRANAQVISEADLGQYLFFEKRLSINNSVSCASCHSPENYFTVSESFGVGHNGALTERNPPVVFNRENSTNQFWDGRAPNLETQAVMPILHPDEMGSSDEKKLISKIKSIPFYNKAFKEIYKKEVTLELIGKSIAQFERTLQSYDASYDRYLKGDKNALTPQQKKGMDLFFNKFKCNNCHDGINFSNEKITTRCYPVLALQLSTKDSISKLPKFKVPTLRNIEKTAPYFHNGSLATIEEAIEFYNNTGKSDFLKDTNSKDTIKLTKQDIADIKAFLFSLTSKPFTLKKLQPAK